jgi:hypothetical protein
MAKNQGLSMEERFWMKVDKRGEDECWEWTGSYREERGYGQIRLNKKLICVHRYSYELAYGPAPDGSEIWRRCNNSLCVNPNHLYIGTHRASEEERFWRHVNKKEDDECWEWNGCRNKEGYGNIRKNATNKSIGAHRYSYELHHGPIPEGELVRHKCHNPPCVNPKHLETGTYKDNSQDAVKADRMPRGECKVNTKLTEGQVRDIKQLLVNRSRVKDIAECFGVSRYVISDIKSGKSWRHVTLDK